MIPVVPSGPLSFAASGPHIEVIQLYLGYLGPRATYLAYLTAIATATAITSQASNQLNSILGWKTPDRTRRNFQATTCLPLTNSRASAGIPPKMCLYYAHAFTCKHLSFSFARFCRPASLIQKPCDQRQIWQTIRLDEACDECLTWFPDKFPMKRQRYQ